MKKIVMFCVLPLLLVSCHFPLDDSFVLPEESASTAERAQSPEAEEAAGQAEPFLYARSFLKPGQQEIYDQLAQLAARYDIEGEIEVPAEIDDADLAEVGAYFCYDHPEHYWALPRISQSVSTGRRVVRLVLADEEVTQEIARERQEEIDKAAAKFLDGVEGDAFGIVTQLHDRIVRDIARDSLYKKESGNLYGALVGKRAVCDGYARLFQYLALKKGVPCIYYEGETKKGTPHAWNAVYVKDSWYYVDVTWDTLDASGLAHTHLCITREELERERVFDTGQYPEIVNADSDAYNYFRRKGYCLESPEESQIVRELAEIFVRELSDMELSEQERPRYLELKIFAPRERYEKIKQVFLQNPFLVLREMDRIAFERRLLFTVTAEGSVSCNYKDVMQILIFLPKVTGV